MVISQVEPPWSPTLDEDPLGSDEPTKVGHTRDVGSREKDVKKTKREVEVRLSLQSSVVDSGHPLLFPSSPGLW